jgi:hypothetical protein
MIVASKLGLQTRVKTNKSLPNSQKSKTVPNWELSQFGTGGTSVMVDRLSTGCGMKS